MNIHIGNLPLDCTEEELRTLFESCGAVEAVEIISNVRTREPLGYGFVVMKTDEEGQKAITTLNNTSLKGKVIVVSKANRPGGRRRRSFSGRPRPR